MTSYTKDKETHGLYDQENLDRDQSKWDIEEQVQFQFRNPMGPFNQALNIPKPDANTKCKLWNFYSLNLSLSIPNFISNEARYHTLFLV